MLRVLFFILGSDTIHCSVVTWRTILSFRMRLLIIEFVLIHTRAYKYKLSSRKRKILPDGSIHSTQRACLVPK